MTAATPGKILLIDDDPGMLDFLRMMLSYQLLAGDASMIVECKDHQQAEEWLKENQAKCALIISDNDTDGSAHGAKGAGVEWIRKNFREGAFSNVPIFLLSGGARRADGSDATGLESEGFPAGRIFMKPPQDAFWEAVKNVYSQAMNKASGWGDRIGAVAPAKRIR